MTESSTRIIFDDGHLPEVKDLLDEGERSIEADELARRANQEKRLESVTDLLKNELTNDLSLIEGLSIFIPTLEELTSPVTMDTLEAAQNIINIYDDIMYRGPENVRGILQFLKKVKELNAKEMELSGESLITQRMVDDSEVILNHAILLDKELAEHGQAYLESYRKARESMTTFFQNLG